MYIYIGAVSVSSTLKSINISIYLIIQELFIFLEKKKGDDMAYLTI